MTNIGIVKWFSNIKGYGFIEYNDEEEIFVHFTGIEKDGYRSLKKGQEVKFDAIEGARGMQATNVVLLPEGDTNKEDEE